MHAALHRRVPSALGALGALLGLFVGTVLRVRRGHVERAMERAGLDPALAPAFFASLGRSALEVVFARLDLVDIDPACVRALEGGAVIAATHTGNFELSAWAAAGVVSALAIVKTQSVGLVDALLRRARAARGLRTHEPKGALRAAREHVARRGAVIMPIDQAPDRARHAVRAPFLGEDALLDRAPAVLARRARVPLVVIASRRDARGRQRVELLDVIDVRDARQATLRANRALERFVRAHPTEWLWMHRRWKRVR